MRIKKNLAHEQNKTKKYYENILLILTKKLRLFSKSITFIERKYLLE